MTDENEIKFRKLREKLDDAGLKKLAIQKLREFADYLEAHPGYPHIMYLQLPNDKIGSELMDSIKVVISYPWPG